MSCHFLVLQHRVLVFQLLKANSDEGEQCQML
jgi:hypothetical protein